MKSVKIRIEFNNKQRTSAIQHCGVSRHAFNYCLNICKNIELSNRDLPKEQKVKLPSAIDLHKIIVKDVKSKFSWYYDVSKFTSQESTRNLQAAYKKFFDELKNGTILKKKNAYISKRKSKGLSVDYDFVNDIGKPKFKKKGQKDSFYLESPRGIKVNGNKIHLPKIGWVKCSEELPDCEIKNCVVSRTADEWFVSFKIPFIPKITEKKFDVVGVDLGIKTLATLSNGKVFENFKPYKKAKKKLRKQNKEVSRRFVKNAKNQSKNYKKSVLKLSKTHAKTANVRKDCLHKITTQLAKDYETVVIEDLQVSEMTSKAKKNKLTSTILDGGFFEFKRQLLYKKSWYGGSVILANKFYPSSKLCYKCGNKKEILKLAERKYKCTSCLLEIDRDLNASLNLNKLAVSSTVSAFGDKSSDSKEFQLIDELGMKHQMFTFV